MDGIGLTLFAVGAIGLVGWMLTTLIHQLRRERASQEPARRTHLLFVIGAALAVGSRPRGSQGIHGQASAPG